MSKIAVNEITDEQGSGRPSFTNGIQTSNINGGQVGGRRNLIINGAMQVAQRGTSETGVGAVVKYANAPDRVKYVSLNNAGTHQYTISQSTTAPEGFGNSYKLDCTTADTALASDVAVFLSVSAMEGQNLQHLAYGTSDAQSITLTFYVRSNKTGTYVAELYNADSFKHIAQTYTIDSADTWERKTLTFVGDTSSGFNNNANRSLEVIFCLGAGANYASGTLPSTWASLIDANRYAGQTVNLADSTANSFYLTGVQLEVGDTATEFEHRSYGEELALCQRYFETSLKTTQTEPFQFTVDGNAFNTRVTVPIFKVEKRAAPSVSIYDNNATTSSAPVSYSGLTPSGATSNQDKDLDQIRSETHSFNIFISSTNEQGTLFFHYEADAEL